MYSDFNKKRVVLPRIGDMIFYNERVFAGSPPVFLGYRSNYVEVIKPGQKGYAIVKIISSSGPNSFTAGREIPVPLFRLASGIYDNDSLHLTNSMQLKSGGHLQGTKNGKPVDLTTAKLGGMSVGAPHSQGGIKGAVGTTKTPIEFEGQEIILTAPLSTNQEKYDFEGKELTAKQIASQLNVDNGGVAFADGGQADTCRCSGKSYKFGGQTITDSDIINYLNFKNKSVHEQILALKNK